MIQFSDPKISVITCFLNEERFLKEAVESILRQDYAHWELLLIDDGSTDESTKIAKRYVSEYPGRIFYYEHEGHANKGLSASRNLAVRQASGELIAFLDGDDVWHTSFLSHSIVKMQQYPVAMVCEASEYWYTWNGTGRNNEIITVGTQGEQVYTPPELMVNLYPIGKGAAPCLCGIVVKKEVVKKYGGFDEAFKGMYEDQVFLCKIYLHEKVYVTSECHNMYRQRQDSLVKTSRLMGRYLQDRKKFLEWLEQYLDKRGAGNPLVNQLLEQALYPYRHPFLHFITNTVPVKWKRLMLKLSA